MLSIRYLHLFLGILLFPFECSFGWTCSTKNDKILLSDVSRRSFLQQCAPAVVVASGWTGPPLARASEEPQEVDNSPAVAASNRGMVPPETVAKLLNEVPTFTIVDPKGVPFMVVGEDAKITGYFFTSYQEAKRILQVARESADKSIREAKRENVPMENDTNPWRNARISTVPMDFAVALVTRSLYANRIRRGGGTYFKIAPSETDIEDALAITQDEDLAEGKVPLFYFEDFSVSQRQATKNPLYFSKAQLEEDYRRMNPGKDSLPPVLVTELFAVIEEMVKPGGTDPDLETLIFVPPKDSVRRAKECQRMGRNEPPFVLGQRNVVL